MTRLRAAARGYGLVLIVAITGLTAYSIWDSRNDALATGRKNTATLAHVLEAQTRHAFKSAEQSLLNAERTLKLVQRDGPVPAAALNALLHEMAASQPHVQAIFVSDRNGRVIHSSSGAAAAHINIADRDYFQVHREHPDRGLYVGPPVTSRVRGAPVINLSRRLSGADGAFEGVVAAAVASDYFQKFYTEFNPGENGAITLFLRDGTLLFRGPPAPEAMGKSFAGTRPFANLLASASSGSYSGSSPFDGVAREYAYRALDGLPLVVVVGVDEQQLLAAWYGYARTASLLALLVILVTIVLAELLAREAGRREALAASLRDSEQQYRYLFEASPLPMWVYDTATLAFLAVNDAALAGYGYSRDEFLALNARDLRPEEDWPRFEQLLASLKPALNASGVWRHKKKTGEVIQVEVTSYEISFEGQAARLVQTQDISSRLEAEIRLRESEQHYRSLFENNPHPVWVMDEQTLRILSANPATVAKYGYTLDELRTMTVIDLQYEEDRAQVEQQLRGRSPTATMQYQRRHVARDGRVIDAEVTAQPFMYGGRPARMILVDDVTERWRAEQALRESEQRYRYLFESSPLPMWVREKETLKFLVVNDAAVAAYGYTREEFLSMTTLDIRPPEDRQRYLQGISIHKDVTEWYAIGRHRKKDGTVIDIEASSRPFEFGKRPARLTVVNDISERKRAEAARAELAAIVENSNDAIIGRTLDGTITSWNAGAERMFGYTAAQAVGQSISFIYPEGHQSRFTENSERLLGGERIGPHELQRRTKDGRIIDVLASLSQVRDGDGRITGASVIFHDITALKQAEKALQRERKLLRTVIDNLPDRIYVKDSARRFMLVNQSDLGHRNLASDEALLGKTVHDIQPRKRADEFDAEDRAVLESGEPMLNREFVMESDDGRKIWMMTNKIPLRDAAGKIFGLIGIHRDITQIRQSAEAIEKLNAELEQRVIERTAQMENTNRELESFAYSVSHDLRAPLRSIDGFSKALLDDYSDRLEPAALDYLRRVRAASQRMAALIDDMLSLSRITRSEMRRQPTDLSALALDIVAELRREQPQRQLDFSVAQGIRVTADPGLMRVALDNLLGNAWKFTSRQPRAIISVGVDGKDGRSVYFIRDNGAGFDMKYAGKLFGAFQRLHREADFTGTGIGLATVQRIIQRHGGRIWAEAAVGKGATFFFTLGDQRG